MVDSVTASTGATRAPQPAAAPGPAYMMPQDVYLGAKADPVQLKRFVMDWVKLGGRGVIGGDGQPASYWDVYQDMAASGIDVSDLPQPDQIPQGTVKGGGSGTPLETPASTAPVPAPPVPGPNPEMTDLLKKLGIDYPDAPSATPGLLAFLRNLGLTVDDAGVAKQRSIDRINRAATDAGSRLTRVGEQEKKNVTADLIRRGVLQSGEANTRYSQQAASLGERQADIARSQAEGIGVTEDTYTAALAAARAQGTGQVLGTEESQGLAKAASAAETEGYRRQQEATDVAYQRAEAARLAGERKQEELLAKYGV